MREKEVLVTAECQPKKGKKKKNDSPAFYEANSQFF